MFLFLYYNYLSMVNINALSEYMKPETLSSGGGGNWITWIILAVFFGIIIVLIIVASIGARKDKMEKLFEADKRNQSNLKADNSRIIIFSSLNKLIVDLEKELIDFKPSVGTTSIGDLNREIINKLKKMKNSDELKEIYESEDYKVEMKPIIDELTRVKPTSWSKDATFSTGLVKVKYDALSKNKDNKEIIKQGEKKEWN